MRPHMDVDELKISIVVPVYNVRQYLSESLDSVINQTYTNIEIIVVDDGSTDGSGMICDEFAAKDSRINVIHQENKGLSGARNAGLDIMTGEVVAFLDSDDTFHPEMIQRMVETMMQNDADVIICRYTSCRTNGRMPYSKIHSNTAESIVYNRRESLRALLSGKIDWYAWNKVYRRECFESVRYPQGQVYEDIVTTYEILDASRKVAVIEEPLIMYRRREESITEKYTFSSAQDRIRSYANIEEKVQTNSPEIFGEQHRQWIFRRRMNVLLETYARCGKSAKIYKTEILELGGILIWKDCDHRTRRFYSIFRVSPLLFKVVYLTLLYVKRGIHSVLDRFGSKGRIR